MLPNCKKSKPGQLNSVDRFSDLPDFIIHYILSFLGTKEAYRTCILSKRFSHISDTNPVLEFIFKHSRVRGTTRRNFEYTDNRMQKYSKESLRIRKLKLVFPTRRDEFLSKVDEWIGIAVHNQVTEFVLRSTKKYKLPGILFSAKLLTCLHCSEITIPYIESIELVSLESLDLSDVVLEEHMLNHIISSCLLLKVLRVTDCSGFTSIVIPRCSKVGVVELSETLPRSGTVVLESSSLENFVYMTEQDFDCEPWRIMSKPGLFINLRMLNISNVGITDDDLAKLVFEAVLLEILVLWTCYLVSNIKISSVRLKKVCFNDCPNLLNVVIDAPNLKKIRFHGEIHPHLSTTICSQAKCDISFGTLAGYLDNQGFLMLKKLLTGLKSCNALKIRFLDAITCDEIEFDYEELGTEQLGAPCNIKELKLIPEGELSESSISAFLDGLFWTCHPDIISLPVDFENLNATIERLLGELQHMVQRWSHPLKRFEAERATGSNLLEEKKLGIQLRLYW